MRQYRGMTKDGKWVYGWYFHGSYNDTDWIHLLDENDAVGPCVQVILSTVGQATGLKDKNGKEIYEGDDVEVSMSFEGGTLPHRGIIEYDNDFGAFGTRNEAGLTLLHNHCLHTLEIIGNIHDKERP